jgi:hypothetical protein
MVKFNCTQTAYEPLFQLAEEQCDPTHYNQEEIDLFLERFVYWNNDEKKFMGILDKWDDSPKWEQSLNEFIDDYFNVMGLDNEFFIKCYKLGFWDSELEEESVADELMEFIMTLAAENAERKDKSNPQKLD